MDFRLRCAARGRFASAGGAGFVALLPENFGDAQMGAVIGGILRQPLAIGLQRLRVPLLLLVGPAQLVEEVGVGAQPQRVQAGCDSVTYLLAEIVDQIGAVIDIGRGNQVDQLGCPLPVGKGEIFKGIEAVAIDAQDLAVSVDGGARIVFVVEPAGADIICL